MPPTRHSSSGSDFASSITVFSLLKEAAWITGPMKFEKSVGGPTFRDWVREIRSGFIAGQSGEGM